MREKIVRIVFICSRKSQEVNLHFHTLHGFPVFDSAEVVLKIKSQKMDYLGFHTTDLATSRHIFKKSTELIPCSPPADLDPRTHLNGPFVSIRKVQKHQELGRLKALEERRCKLRELIQCDRQKWRCELIQRGFARSVDNILGPD